MKQITYFLSICAGLRPLAETLSKTLFHCVLIDNSKGTSVASNRSVHSTTSKPSSEDVYQPLFLSNYPVSTEQKSCKPYKSHITCELVTESPGYTVE